MNNRLLLAMCIFLLFSPADALQAQKKYISEHEASVVAKNRMKRDFPDRNNEITRIGKKFDKEGNVLLYEITGKDNITVLLSGHRACLPVLAVFDSRIGSVVEGYDKLPCGMQCLVGGYFDQLSMAFQNEALELYHQKTWDSLYHDTMATTRNPLYQVGPLTTSEWGQSSSNDSQDPCAYNYHIGGNSDCQHCLVGCVAVAMGQIMYYHKFPVLQYHKAMQFDWCNMPDSLLTSDENYFKQREAVSSLLYECAESVRMNYGCQGSSSHDLHARNSLVNHFSYSSDAQRVYRSFYKDSDWIGMLKQDLGQNRPVLYSGDRYDDEGRHGHSFVCDGYNSRDEFHFNFGQPFSNNTTNYFAIVNLVPNQGMIYIHGHSAVFHIYPNHQHSYCNINLHLEDYYDVFYETHHSNDCPPYTIVPTTMAWLASASVASRYVYRTIPAGATAVYRAHEEVELRDGFTVEAGADFTAEIVPCPNCEQREVVHSHDYVDNGSVGISDEGDTPAEYATRPQPELPSADLYPNPTSGEVTVAVEGEVQAVDIYNAAGQAVGGWGTLSMAPGRVTLDVSALPEGAYVVKVRTPAGTAVKKLLVSRR